MRGLFLFFLGAAALLGGDAGVKRHQDYRAQAASAYAQKNYPAAKEATLAALRLRPDSPSYLHNLAALCALMEDTSGAFAALRQIAAVPGISEVPIVFLYNKRDLPNAAPLEYLDEVLNRAGAPRFATVATTGEGLAEALSELSRIVLR